MMTVMMMMMITIIARQFFGCRSSGLVVSPAWRSFCNFWNSGTYVVGKKMEKKNNNNNNNIIIKNNN